MTQNQELTQHGLDKISRYKWIQKNEPGEMQYIDKHALSVDHAYQRAAKHKTKILQIAKEWNWVSLGAIIVSKRPDGRMFVVDGQHRVLASLKRSDVERLPCIIHNMGSVVSEASSFIESNVGRKPVKASEKHKAALLAQDPVAIRVQGLLDQGGKQISTGSKIPDGLQCVGLMNRLAQNHYESLSKIWPLICELTRGIYCSERLIEGLLYIENRMADGESLMDARWRQRIMGIGNDELIRAAGEGAAFFSKGGAKPWAIGIANRINKGLRKKLEVI